MEKLKFVILFQEMIYVIPESIVVAIYWVLNSFIFVSFSFLFIKTIKNYVEMKK